MFKLIIFLLLFTKQTLAEEIKSLKKVDEGKSIELSENFLKKDDNKYEYIPSDKEYWAEYKELLKEKKYDKILNISKSRINEFGEDTEEGKEALITLASGLIEKQYYIAGFYFLETIVRENIGTNFGQLALNFINDLAKKDVIDESMFERIILSNDFSGYNEEVKDFVTFHKYIYNLKKNLNKWAKNKFEKISNKNYWTFKINYFVALSELAKGNSEIFKQILDELTSIVDHDTLKNKIKLQLARFSFEKGDFKKHMKIIDSLESVALREKGRIILEKAWSQYYLKNYSEALGLLNTLKSPLFSDSIVPERYVLEMIIYKELCHYDLVTQASKEYKKAFSKVIRHIERRKNLSKNKTLFSMALLDIKYQKKANVISHIIKEKRALKKWLSDIYSYKQIYRFYRQTSYVLRKNIERNIEAKLREVAKEFIDTDEQVKFINYTTELDKLRPNLVKSEKIYEAQTIDTYNFDTIYWPLQKEFWYDEVYKYKSLIASRCEMKGEE